MWANVNVELCSFPLTFDTFTADVETIFTADLKDDAFLRFAVLAHAAAVSILTGQQGCRKTRYFPARRSFVLQKHFLRYGGTLGLLLPKNTVKERRQTSPTVLSHWQKNNRCDFKMSLERLPLQYNASGMCHHQLKTFCFHDSLYTVFDNCTTLPELFEQWTGGTFKTSGDKPFAGSPLRWLACVHWFRKVEFTGGN